MKLNILELAAQEIAAVVSMPFLLAFQIIGVFVNACYLGFRKGWRQSWIDGEYKEET